VTDNTSLDPSSDDAPEESRLFVTSLARGIKVLTAFWEGKPSMNLVELAEAAGMTKSAAQRFSHTLLTIGYLKKDPVTKEYSLAPRSLEVGLRYLQTNSLLSSATPYLHALTRTCEETVTLSERDALHMTYISRFPSHKEMFVNMPLGMRIPMYCTAGGRAFMSRMGTKEVTEILEQSERVAYTSTTMTRINEIRNAVAQATEDGFASTNGEYYTGDITVSAAILGPSGEPLGAVNVSAPSSRWSFEQARAELGPQVVEAARAIGSSGFARQRTRRKS
jgi:IclR family pca regulon transcriptional regulator